MIAISIAAPTISETLRRVHLAEPLADFIEFRLDYLTDLSLADPLPVVERMIHATTRPVILTFHGDRIAASFQEQVALWRTLFKLALQERVYFDLDLRLVEWFESRTNPVPWPNVIVSHHDFEETPATLPGTFERMKSTPAAILKIATNAADISDNLAIFELLERARIDERRLIGLAMGEAGIMTRILSPAYGGFLTFASLAPEEKTAPGQFTAEELCRLYHIRDLSVTTKVAGVIGDPVGHSLSPALHNAAYARLGLDWVYLPFLVRHLGRFMCDFVKPATRRMKWDLRGLSVTIPHKVEIVRYLDGLDSCAERAEAVNTVVVESGRLIGYNTDVEGAMNPLRKRVDLKGSRTVLLGAGGAARAVGYGLKQAGAQLTILARDAVKAGALADRLGAQAGLIDDLSKHDYDVLINATPVGMGKAAGETPVPSELLRSGAIVFDLIPRREDTRLLKDARAAGCITIDGLEMLVCQAALQFGLWTRQEAPIETMMQTAYGDSSL
jgi:3-dehydroquinate dehydratase / shikimate dehydrogenase